MKKWLKWTFGIIGFIVIVTGIFIIWNWSSFAILRGTEGLTGDTTDIPKVSTAGLDTLTTGAADWTSWYGPDGDFRSRVSSIRTDWSSGLNKLWEVNYLCQGDAGAAWSAPVIQGNRLIACGRDSDNDLIFALDPEKGDLLWYQSYPAEAKTNHGAGPRATPFIDQERVYTFGRNGDLVCWSLFDGERLWHNDVLDLGGAEPTWGYSSSPLVLGDLVLVQGGGNIRTIAFDKLSGEMVWQSGQGLPGYAALQKMNYMNTSLILAFHGKGLAAIDARKGTELWDYPWETDYDVNATTPLVLDDRVFITSGYGTGSMLLRIRKDRADSLWRSDEFSSIHSDPYLINGYLYGYSGDSFQNKGAFKCIDIKNGEVKWSTNEMGWGTCTYVDGHLICCDIKGNIFLMKPDPGKFLKVTESSSALGDIRGPVWTIPVVANGRLYLRFKQKLICYMISR